MAGDERSPKTALFQRPFALWLQRLVVAATAAYAALVVFATHYPKPQELVGPLPSDKLLHFVAYGLLGFLAALVLRSRGRLVGRVTPLLAAGLAVWCVIDEATQPLFGRHADPLDWMYDVIGLAVGIGTVLAVSMLTEWLEGRRPG